MNYPITKIARNKVISYANRGMNLEDDINITNRYYLDNDIAIIHKKPTPIKVVKMDYSRNVIKEAFFQIPSTTDYNGIYKGKYIDFEAKETKSKSSFALKNIHSHQIKHLIEVEKHGGISFLIIRFTTLDKTFLFETKYLKKFTNNNERKSIPLSFIEENGFIIKNGYNPRIDYIKIVDNLI